MASLWSYTNIFILYKFLFYIHVSYFSCHNLYRQEAYFQHILLMHSATFDYRFVLLHIRTFHCPNKFRPNLYIRDTDFTTDKVIGKIRFFIRKLSKNGHISQYDYFKTLFRLFIIRNFPKTSQQHKKDWGYNNQIGIKKPEHQVRSYQTNSANNDYIFQIFYHLIKNSSN